MRGQSYLTGQLGSMLRKSLEGVEFAYTGVVKCQAVDKPTPSQCKACSVYLAGEIKRIKPKYVLVVGATAAKAVCKAARLGEVMGKIIDRDGIKYFPCYSPAYVLRDPSKENEFKLTIKRFKDLVSGKGPTVKQDLRIRVINRSNLEEFQDKFSGEAEFTCDLETTGLDWYHPLSRINCAAMYLPKCGESWVLPVNKDPTLPLLAIAKLLKWMEEQDIPVINQNWKFDSLWLWNKFGVQFFNIFDTMLAHYNLDENTLHGLKENARIHLNAPDYDLTLSEKKGNVDSKKLFTYAAWDAYYTYELKKLYSRELMKDRETRNIFYTLTMPASRMYEELEREGHYIDMDLFRSTEASLKKSLVEEEASLNRTLGRVINWNSPAQVSKALYGDLGLIPTVFTDSGANSTGEAALADLSHPIVDQLIAFRGTGKMLSTYIEGWKEFMVGSYLYLGTKIQGTVTGRFSSRMHQVPRDGTIRNLITAPPGWTFVQVDLSQAEVRVIAMMASDKELIKCYNDNIDVHWRTAMGILSLGGSSDVDLSIKTCEMYCLRSGLPSNRNSVQMLQSLWVKNKERESTESTITQARKAWAASMEDATEGLSKLSDQLPSLRSCSEILSIMCLRSGRSEEKSEVPEWWGIPDNSESELSNLWGRSSKEGYLLQFLQEEGSQRKSVSEKSEQGGNINPWSREWGKSGRKFESLMEGWNQSKSTEEMDETYLRMLWIYSILSSPPQRSEQREQPGIQLPDAVSLLSSIGPSTAQSISKDWKEIRKKAKATVFGLSYGMGAKKFCEYAKVKYSWDVPLLEAQSVRDAFFNTYSSLEKWHERQRAFVRMDGFVRSLSGRKRRLPGINSPDRQVSAECERQAINAPVQGFIGDLKLMGMLDIYDQLHGEYLKLKSEVHDAILLWIRDDKLAEMLPRVKFCVEHPSWIDRFGVKLTVPIIADIEIGPWGAGTTYKGD